VLERERHAARIELPWPNDPSIALVLVSFSTAPEQGSVTKFQNAMDALAALPVRGVVTVGDSIDPGALQRHSNVAIFATADHDDLMVLADLVVTHGGHGTFMRALKHGLPLVVIPGLGGDQPVNAAAAEAWGVGLALPSDAPSEAIKGAIEAVLASPAFSERATEISRQLAGDEGANRAADEIEGMLSAQLRGAS
jgi:UDP:flavonoid glycosyltransferase YjiC (YdhE family)